MTALAADTSCALLEERLSAWFQALVDAPVPEHLLQHLDRLADGEPEATEPR